LAPYVRIVVVETKRNASLKRNIGGNLLDIKNLPRVAYFCMEYGLSSDFKTYAGGLGILAGDHLKGSKDLSLPLVGIGLKWKQGYTEQFIDEDGEVYDTYHNYHYDFLVDTEVKVTVKIRKYRYSV